MPVLVTLLILLVISLLSGSRFFFGPSFSGPESPYDPPERRRKIRIAGLAMVVIWVMLATMLLAGVVMVGSRNEREANEKTVKAAAEEQQRRKAREAEPFLPTYRKSYPPQKLLPPAKRFGK